MLLAILVTAFIPELIHYESRHNSQTESGVTHNMGRNASKYYYTSMQYQRKDNQCVSSNTIDGKGSPLGSAEEDNTCEHSLKSVTSPLRVNDDHRFEIYKRGPTTSEAQLPLMQNLDPL